MISTILTKKKHHHMKPKVVAIMKAMNLLTILQKNLIRMMKNMKIVLNTHLSTLTSKLNIVTILLNTLNTQMRKTLYGLQKKVKVMRILTLIK